jgi:hypothetical protein
MIKVINIRSYKGEYEYIGRPSVLGNPFVAHGESERMTVIAQYRRWLWDEFRKPGAVHDEIVRLFEISQHGDLVLGCWCSPKPCHGEVIKALIEWLSGKGSYLLSVLMINKALGIKPVHIH